MAIALTCALGAQAAGCPIPGATRFAQVAWPGTPAWSSSAISSATGQTFNFTSNIPGYSNSVTVKKISAAAFTTDPSTYTRTYAFTGAGPLSNATINYIDYMQRSNGVVQFDFSAPLDSNDSLLLMDLDLTESIKFEFYDAANNLLSTLSWTAPLIRSVTGGSNPNGTLTIGATNISVVGSPINTPDASYLMTPPAGQAVSRVVATGSSSSNGTWDISFVHGDCGIDAIDDNFTATPIDMLSGGNTASVYSNDTLNDSAFAPLAVTPSILNDGGITGLTINADGTLTVPANTPAATYNVSYQICNSAQPSNCDQAVAQITVGAPVIVATADLSLPPLLSTAGGTTASVFGNDTINGLAFVPTNVTPSLVNNGGISGLVVNADGTLSVPPGTSAGSYNVIYQICISAAPAYCSQATAVVKVDPPISAVNDNLGGFGVGAHLNVGNVLTNDLVDGVAASAGNVTLSVITPAGASGPLPTLNTSTGAIDIAAGTPNGAYTIRYQICAVNRPNNCAQANVTLAVAQPAAVDDSSANNSIGSVVTLNVLANDLSVGGPVLVPGSVVIVGAPGSGKQLVVAGQGVWQVNAATGAISFTPDPGFTANPTPIHYTVQDSAGYTSNPAAVTISYLNTPNAVPTSVPTLSFWGMLIAALCLIAVGSAQLSQRRKIK